jgi:hypothetical protein
VDVFNEVKKSLHDLDVGPKAIRNFGIMFGVIFFILVGLIVYKHWEEWAIIARHPWAWGFAIAGLVFLGLGYLWPKVLIGPYRVWMGFALALGVIMSALILSVVFYVLITPIGLMMRLVSQDPMHRKIDRAAASYWTERRPDSNDPKRIEKMF